MAPFDPDGNQPPDYFLLRDGFVTLFHDVQTLDATLDALTGYHVARLDASAWTTPADFHRAVKEALGFPDYYGHNLDAFNDCLREVAASTVLAFVGYDAFVRRQPRVAQAVLDIFASSARFGLLFGRRMVCLVQSDDPELAFAPVGCQVIGWYSS